MKHTVNYDIELDNIKPGQIFTMLNYDGKLFIKVAASEHLKVCHEYTFAKEWHALETDGHHHAIIELGTGKFSYMSKIKPCKLFHGIGSGIVE